jgi:catechol 2,3-dioxygenase-like lactoylglutathione lyase family enzyme
VPGSAAVFDIGFGLTTISLTHDAAVATRVCRVRAIAAISVFPALPQRTRPIILPENTTLCFNRSKEGGTMRVRRLDHVLLAMPAGRELEARNFYSGILGIPEARKPAELAGRGGCWFEDGELKVHLGVEKNFAPARKAHPAFVVEDLAALTAKLVGAGCPISHDEPLEGYDRIFVHDPFGNRIELLEVKAPSPRA